MLTTTTILESTVTYGIVHAVWVGIRWVAKRVTTELRKERNRIIRNHVKADHEGRLKHCLDEACASLRMPGWHHSQELPPVASKQARTEP